MGKKKVKCIVIVDDDEDLLKILSYEFHELGYEVKSFTTGKSASAFLLDKKNLSDVHLIILDRILPSMDGLDILQKIKEKIGHKIPVIIISILDSEKDILAGLEGGAIDYITKPFSIALLMRKATQLLKSS